MKILCRLGIAVAIAGCSAQNGHVAGDRGQDVRLASIELASGSPEAALQVLQTHLTAAPDDVAALVLAGDAEAALGQTEVAAASYRRALSAGPVAGASLGLARLSLAREPAVAAAALAALLVHTPRDARIWTDLGVAHDLLGEPAKAQDCYRRAMALDPALVSPQVNLGLSLALSGRAKEGMAMLASLAAGPRSSPKIREDLAVAEAMAGETAAARATLGAELPALQVSSAIDGFAALRATGLP